VTIPTTPVRMRAMCAAMLTAALTSCGGGGSDGPSTPSEDFHPANTAIPVSGPEIAGLQPLDQAVTTFMRTNNVPAVTIAMAKDGRLILARGYGYADLEARQAVQPDSMFRIASITKVLTGLAIARLHDQTQLDLDQPFLNLLPEYDTQQVGDARIRQITVRNLLMHLGGWDRDAWGDPLFMDARIAQDQGVPRPVTCPDIIRFMMRQPLQIQPGTRVVYSNFGYCILGKVVEKVSGQTFESYVREQVLAPLGVHAMSVGKSRVSERGPFEVKYYGPPGDGYVDSPYPGEERVPAPYGVELLAHNASGGWIASAIDLTRVMTAIDGSRVTGFLSPDTRTQLTARPNPGFAGTSWYGFGLFVGPTEDTYYHGGSLPGTLTLLRHNADGYTFAILTNTRPNNSDRFFDQLVGVVLQALGPAFAGSSTDLYTQYPSPSLPARTP
jgi:N-acyl-D-amino-acid deacylase